MGLAVIAAALAARPAPHVRAVFFGLVAAILTAYSSSLGPGCAHRHERRRSRRRVIIGDAAAAGSHSGGVKISLQEWTRMWMMHRVVMVLVLLMLVP